MEDMKKAAPFISYLLHPLLMPSLGLLIILNSGTYLSLLDPAAKRAIIFVLALGTLVFTLMMLPILHFKERTGRHPGGSPGSPDYYSDTLHHHLHLFQKTSP